MFRQMHGHVHTDSLSSAMEYSSLVDNGSHRSTGSSTGNNNSASANHGNNDTSNTKKKPHPLKQRTSSVDTRKDYSYISTWWSLRDLVKPREWFLTVNNFPIWRRHLAWAMNENGGDFRNYVTSRYASSMVFASLLLAAELNVLFDSAALTTEIRHALQQEAYWKLQFWIGLVILTSILLTLMSLIIIYTAWGIVSAISDENAHCILRSSIGQYVGELPHRFIVSSIYSFLLWILMTIFLLLPLGLWSILLILFVLGLFVHVNMAFSSLGRLIIHTTAMSPNRIFEERYEQSLTPQPLQEQLYNRAKAELQNNTSITRQYRRPLEPMGQYYEVNDLALLLRQGREGGGLGQGSYANDTTTTTPDRKSSSTSPLMHMIGTTIHDNVHDKQPRTSSFSNYGPGRVRTDSTVRFADQLLVTTTSNFSNNHNNTTTASAAATVSTMTAIPSLDTVINHRGTTMQSDPPSSIRDRFFMTPTAEGPSSVASSSGPSMTFQRPMSNDSLLDEKEEKFVLSTDKKTTIMIRRPKETSISPIPPPLPSRPSNELLQRHESMPPTGLSVDSLRSWLTTTTTMTPPPPGLDCITTETSTKREALEHELILRNPRDEKSRLRNCSTVSSCSMEGEENITQHDQHQQKQRRPLLSNNDEADDDNLLSPSGYNVNTNRALTEDEKFDLDYGDDHHYDDHDELGTTFPPFATPTIPSFANSHFTSNNVIAVTATANGDIDSVDNDVAKNERLEETTRLLGTPTSTGGWNRNAPPPRNDYSSFQRKNEEWADNNPV